MAIPSLAYDTIATLDWHFGGQTADGERYEISIQQEIRPESFSGFGLAAIFNFWDFRPPFSGTPANDFGLPAQIEVTIDGETRVDIDDDPSSPTNSLQIFRGSNGAVIEPGTDPLPGEDRLSLGLAG